MARQRIYAKDTCNNNLVGPAVVVQGGGEIPDVSRTGAALLALSLLVAIVLTNRPPRLSARSR